MNDLAWSADLAVISWLARWLLSGLALFAAADMALMLRLTQAPTRWCRRVAAASATALAIAASHWFIVATYLGQALGLGPVESARRLGPVLAWALTSLSLGPADWFLLAVSLPLAARWAGKGRAS